MKKGSESAKLTHLLTQRLSLPSPSELKPEWNLIPWHHHIVRPCRGVHFQALPLFSSLLLSALPCLRREAAAAGRSGRLGG